MCAWQARTGEHESGCIGENVQLTAVKLCDYGTAPVLSCVLSPNVITHYIKPTLLSVNLQNGNYTSTKTCKID